MPGLYINDGGGLSSALGNAVAGFANINDPKTIAEAALLKEQTLKAYADTAQAEDLLHTGRMAEYKLPDTMTALGINLPAPAGGVAGTVASMAVPPGGTTGAPATVAPAVPYDWHTPVDESGFTGPQTYLANELRNGRLGADALKTDVNTFQGRMPGGPGMTDQAIQTRSTMPLSSGQTINVTGLPDGSGPGGAAGGAPGGHTMSGGSVYDQKIDETMAAAAPADAKHTIDVGNDANGHLGQVVAIQHAYDMTVAPEYTPSGMVSEKWAQNAAAYLGLPVPEILKMGAPGVKAEIRKQFAGMVANLRDNQGQPMFKGGLDQIMAQFPDPDSSPEQFHRAMQALTTTLQQQKKDGDSALAWYGNQSKQGYVKLLQQQSQHAAEARAAFASAGMRDTAEGAGGGESGGGGGGGGLRPPSPDEVNQYHAAVAAGRNPAEIKEIFRMRHHIDPTQLN